MAFAVGPAPLRDFPGVRTAEGRPVLRILKHEWNYIIRTDHARAADDPRSSGLYVIPMVPCTSGKTPTVRRARRRRAAGRGRPPAATLGTRELVYS